jgi:hypothetical protein
LLYFKKNVTQYACDEEIFAAKYYFEAPEKNYEVGSRKFSVSCSLIGSDKSLYFAIVHSSCLSRKTRKQQRMRYLKIIGRHAAKIHNQSLVFYRA